MITIYKMTLEPSVIQQRNESTDVQAMSYIYIATSTLLQGYDTIQNDKSILIMKLFQCFNSPYKSAMNIAVSFSVIRF